LAADISEWTGLNINDATRVLAEDREQWRKILRAASPSYEERHDATIKEQVSVHKIAFFMSKDAPLIRRSAIDPPDAQNKNPLTFREK